MIEENTIWDFIIVGTGMGGGPVGKILAEAGHSVLFLEQGRSPDSPNAIKGQFAEVASINSNSNDTFAAAGRSSQVFINQGVRGSPRILPFLGSGVGGSSALYGMVMERFHARDFLTWPIIPGEIEGYYGLAEKLFRVSRISKPDHPGNQRLLKYLENQGLNSYFLPLANDDGPDCGSCQSILCASGCKNDSYKICVAPALASGNAKLLTEFRVNKLHVSEGLVTGVTGHWQKKNITLRSKTVILSAGALQTPLLLLASDLNPSKQVGKNLMRHLVDLYALKIDSDPSNKKIKEIGFFETHTVQSFGRLPPPEVLFEQLKSNVTLNYGVLMAKAVAALRPLFIGVFGKISAGRLVMASILEDAPSSENRIWQSGDDVFLSYEISATDNENLQKSRRRLKKLFKPFSPLLIKAAEKNEMLAHACGTCRMGENPGTSVVDPKGKVHGIKNLFVSDASVFPTSGRANPALTIAANSLRLANFILKDSK